MFAGQSTGAETSPRASFAVWLARGGPGSAAIPLRAMTTPEVSFSARLHEVLSGYHRQPEVARLLAREADRKAKARADQRKALADCAAEPACARDMRREGIPEAAIADAVKAERDRAILAGMPQINRLLTDLAELRALL
jgi:hypothetical protein